MGFVDLSTTGFAESEGLAFFDRFEIPVGQFFRRIFLIGQSLFFLQFKDTFAGRTHAKVVQIPTYGWNKKDVKGVIPLDDFFRQSAVALLAFHLAVSE